MQVDQPEHLASPPRDTRDGRLAVVSGETLHEPPADLYIPPDAFEVFLEAFEGPLDLLLYLIRRKNLDVLEVSVAEITAQYLRYIELMQVHKLELAAEYLLMAATLALMKSRMLLPRQDSGEDEEDPRTELIRRLQEYEQVKAAAEAIDTIPRVEREIFPLRPKRPETVRRRADPPVALEAVLVALADVLQRAEMHERHRVPVEPLSVRERMSDVLARLAGGGDFVSFTELFRAEEGRRGVVVTFLAITELIRENLIDFVQNEPFAPIHVRVA